MNSSVGMRLIRNQAGLTIDIVRFYRFACIQLARVCASKGVDRWNDPWF